MKILVTGSTGLIGSALTPRLEESGHQIVRLIRDRAATSDTRKFWNPETGEMDESATDGIDAVIHLAGENVAAKRWSEDVKKRIRESRVKSSNLLRERMLAAKAIPKTFVGASAVGYYGDRGDDWVDEESARGQGFLAEIGEAWENAAQPLEDRGGRVAHMRIGVVLSKAGGALQKLLPPFKMGLGGKLGNGRQFMSWIALDDVVEAFVHAVESESARGPMNLVAPNPVRNSEFTKALGNALGRPTFFGVPGFAAKLALGEMADELLFASVRAGCDKLRESGFEFRYPNLPEALKAVLAK